jgi:hypothetical protein
MSTWTNSLFSSMPGNENAGNLSPTVFNMFS